MNVSDPQGASSRGLHITYRLTRLIALFILQRKASTSSVRRGDDYKKQDESLEQVNDGWRADVYLRAPRITSNLLALNLL